MNGCPECGSEIWYTGLVKIACSGYGCVNYRGEEYRPEPPKPPETRTQESEDIDEPAWAFSWERPNVGLVREISMEYSIDVDDGPLSQMGERTPFGEVCPKTFTRQDLIESIAKELARRLKNASKVSFY